MDMIQTKATMAELGCPAVALATVTRISKSRVSEILSGQYQPVNGEIPQIETALSEMKALRDEYPSLPIDFSDGVRIRQLLQSRRESPAREIGNITRELKIPFSVFVQLQFHEPISLLDANRVLNNAAEANPAHVQALLQLARQLRDYAQTFPDQDWRDVYAVKAVLRRWAEIERARVSAK